MTQSATLDIDLKELHVPVVFGAGMKEVAKITIHFKYACTKRLGKCIDDFVIVARIHNPKYGIVDCVLSDPEYRGEGKLVVNKPAVSTTPSYIEVQIPVLVKKGRANEELYMELTISYGPQQLVEKDVLFIKVARVFPKKKVHEDLLSKTLEITILPPYTVEADLPSSLRGKVLYVGDVIDINIKIKSHIGNRIRALFTAPGEEITKTYILHPNEVFTDKTRLKINNTGKEITITFVDDVTGYEEKRVIPIVVEKPPRTEVVRYWIEGSVIPGSTIKLFIEIKNNDEVAPVKTKLFVKAYGSETKTEVELKPGETKVIETSLDVTTEGEKTILVEEVAGESKPVTYLLELTRLPSITKPSIRIELVDSKLDVILGEEALTGIIIANPVEIPLNPVISVEAPSQISVEVEEKSIEPKKTTALKVRVTGLKPGEYTILFNVGVFNRSVELYRERLRLRVKVLERFKVYLAKILSPLGGENVIVGEKAVLFLDIQNNYGKKIVVNVNSTDVLRLLSKSITLEPGRHVYEIGCIAEKPGKATIFIYDEVCEEAVDSINEVLEPIVEANLSIVGEAYTGVPARLRINLVNQTHLTLKIKYMLKAIDNALFVIGGRQERTIKGEVFLEAGPGTSFTESYNMIIPKHGRSVIELTYVPISIVDNKQIRGSEIVLKKEFRAKYPIQLIVSKNKFTIKNPYPKVKTIFGKDCRFIQVDLKIVNKSNKQLTGIEMYTESKDLNSYLDTGTVRSKYLKNLNLEEKGETRLGVMIEVPYSLQDDREVKITATIPGSVDKIEESILIDIKPQLFIDVLYPPNSYDHACLEKYPYVILENKWAEVLLPVTENPLNCGAPYEASRVLFNIAKEFLYLYKRNGLMKANDFYSLIAKYIIETMLPEGNVPQVRNEIGKAIENYVAKQKDYVVLIELAWAITLCKYTRACNEESYNRLVELLESEHVPQTIIPLGKDKIVINPNTVYMQVKRILLHPYSEPLIPKDPVAGEIMAMYTLLSGKPVFNYGVLKYLVEKYYEKPLMMALASGGWRTLLNTRFTKHLRTLLKMLGEAKVNLAAALITRYIAYKDYRRPGYAKPLFKGMSTSDLEGLARGII